MSPRTALPSVARALTSTRGARITLVISLLVFVALFGLFGRASLTAASATAPPNSEAVQAQELLATFPHADREALMLVATRDDGGALSDDDVAALNAVTEKLAPFAAVDPRPATLSEDSHAALTQLSVTGVSESAARAELVADVRAAVHADTPSGMVIQVTGGPAFGADITGAFAGADFTLLLVTILIVAVLLILTYRSPVLWLIPLAVVAFADQLASKVTAAIGTALELQFDSGIISVLVFGAGTNYALLLISRYREELHRTQDHRAALATAWRGSFGAIVASNFTVVLSLLTLAFAVIPGTRGLGIASAVGLLIALAAVLFPLTAVLAMSGRRVFWPFVPRPGDDREQGRGWRAVARGVVRRPVLALAGGAVVLAISAAGLATTSLGLDQVEQFRVPSESAAGLETLSAHFPAGEAQPMMIVADGERGDEVASAVGEIDGVTRAMVIGETDDGTLAKIMATGEPVPGSEASFTLVEKVREVAHATDASSLVGGAVATELDARDGNLRDLALIAPLVLAVSFLMLLILLRSLVAPLVLLVINVASAAAAIGLGAWLNPVVFGLHALDLQVPLLSFLFLVALGVDYTIFLVHRTRAEAATHGTRDGIVRAVAATGGVITSAGIVLAGVFAALGVLPLVTLGQLGVIVGIGVLLDTLLVRTIMVPAVFALLGDRVWWPGALPRVPESAPADVATPEAAEHVDPVRSV